MDEVTQEFLIESNELLDQLDRDLVDLEKDTGSAEDTLAEICVPQPKGRLRQRPKRVIADRGDDSDPLRARLKKRGVELIASQSNNRDRRYEGRRKLRRYKRRWIVEHTNAWLGQFRRLLVSAEGIEPSTY